MSVRELISPDVDIRAAVRVYFAERSGAPPVRDEGSQPPPMQLHHRPMDLSFPALAVSQAVSANLEFELIL